MINKLKPCLFLALCLLPFSAAHSTDLTWASKSVVKLFITQQAWKVSEPWSKTGARQGTCTGFFIKQGILTNAHCIADVTYIEVEIPGKPDKVEASLVAVNHQIDLALLKLSEPDVAKDVARIEFGDLPDLRDKVVTVGYPTGGRQVSYTEGVVSRIDEMTYVHSNIVAPLVQTDASINKGNSGGPVFSDQTGKCIGVATQKSSAGEGLGYFIPTPIIRQFLLDLKDDKIDGIPALSAFFQTLENPAARESLKLTKDQSGIRIRSMAKDGSLDGVLEENDVLLNIDGHNILNDGRVPFQGTGRIWLGYYVATRQIGDHLTLKVARDGKVLTKKIKLKRLRLTLVPREPMYDKQTPYYVAGGLLFIAVEQRYFWRWGGNWAEKIPTSLKRYAGSLYGHDDLEQLVIISEVFDASVNKGYSGEIENIRVVKVNGKDIKRLSDISEALENNKSDFHVIELESNIQVVLDRQRARVEDMMIRKRYGIH